MLPAAIAGATLATIWFIGQFHGVISATTPIGSWTTLFLPVLSSNSKPFSASIVDIEMAEAGARLRGLRERDRRAHLLGDRLGDVGDALLIFLDDALEQRDAGRPSRSARSSRTPCGRP